MSAATTTPSVTNTPVMVDTQPELLISLSDVASLAQVQRPVVSMWRRRSASSAQPFPAPVPTGASLKRFDATAVVRWLEDTGRGNNRDPRADLAAFAVPADIPLQEPAVLAGVTGLLALTAAHGLLPDNRDELLDLADSDDPDDEVLYSEVESLGDRLLPLARYVTDLTDAAYGPAAAFEAMMANRFRLFIEGHVQTAVAQEVRDLVVAAALALGTQAELDGAMVVDPIAGGTDLVVDLARRVAEAGAVSVATPDRRTPAARLARRRLRVHGIPRVRLLEDGQGGFDFPAPAVVVMQLPPVDQPTMSDTDVLRLLNDIAVCCTAGQRVVVLGPAGALTDQAVEAEVTDLRRDLLRTDLVRAVVRLPYGMLTAQGRRRLALWCLGPPPEWSSVGSRTVVADLANEALDAATIDALVADLVAGLEGRRGRAHTLQLSRSEATSALQLSEGDLAMPIAPATAAGFSAGDVAQLVELAETLRTPLPEWWAPPVVPRRAAARRMVTTVADVVRSRQVAVLPGARLAESDLTTAERGVRVLGPAQVAGDHGALPPPRIDPLVLAARYPASRLTEPGDVVFCTAPRPMAQVDRNGGSVAVFPAKVLRCRDRRLLPAVVAADIKSQPPTAKTWRAWALRYVPEDQVSDLAVTMEDIDAHRRALRDRLDTLDDLSELLLTGVAGGSLDLIPTKGT